MRARLLRTPLLAAAILKDAVLALGRNWRPLGLALIVPVLGLAVVRQVSISFGASQAALWLLLAPQLFFYVLFAMSCHRIVLLGKTALPNRFGLYWSMRELRFTGWLLVLFALTAAIWVSISQAVLAAGYTVTTPIWFGIYFLTVWLEARIGMVFPATAVGQPADLARSWRMTRGSGLAIAIPLFVAIIAGDLLISLLDAVLMQPEFPILAFVNDLVTIPLIALGVAILSVSYRHLASRGSEPRPDIDVRNI